MRLRTLLVSSPHAPLEETGWNAVGVRVRAHEGFSLIGEALGEEALGFASLSRPDLLIVAWSAAFEGLLGELRAAVPEARLLLVNGPEGMEGVTSLENLEAALERIHAETDRKASARPSRGKLLVVYGAKGGSGRSQLATNLAIALVRGTARETILFDGALEHGEQDLYLNVQPPGLSGVSAAHGLEGAFAAHPTGIKLLASSSSEPTLSGARLGQLLQGLLQRDAWIVADTHPSLRELNRELLAHAERVYVPMAPDLSHLRAMQRELALCRDHGIDTSRFEFACWSERSEVSREDMARTLKRPIDWIMPYDPGRVRSAINQGIPILQSDPRGPLAKELARMVAALGESRPTMALVANHAQPWQGVLNWLRRGPAPNGFGT